MHIFSDTSLQMKETVNPVHLYRLHKQIVWVPCGSMVCQGTAGGNGRERFPPYVKTKQLNYCLNNIASRGG